MLVAVEVSENCFFIQDQAFSMGLRSGLLPGQSITLLVPEEKWAPFASIAYRQLPSSLFLFYKKASQMRSFCLRAVKFLQPHHTGRLHTQYEAQGQGGTTSRADAILIFRGVNLSVVHYISLYPIQTATVTAIPSKTLYRYCLVVKQSLLQNMLRKHTHERKVFICGLT